MPDGASNPEQDASGEGMAAVWRALRGSDFILSARRLWVISSKLHHAGHPRLARVLKNFNSMLYHNSLPPEVTLSPDVRLGHHGVGTVLHPKVTIGKHVKIFQNVTMAVRPPNAPQRIVIEDGVVIGANAVIMTPRNRSVRIGQGARVGAGAVVTHDVPPRTIAISQPVELRPRSPAGAGTDHVEDEG
jgi:serine O-acetyltransferase